MLKKSLLDLFTNDVLQSVDRSHGKVEEVPEDDDDTYLDEDLSENDDPYIDEDGNFLANEQIVSDIGDDLALDACTAWCKIKHICRSFEAFLSTRLLEWCLKHWINGAMVIMDFHMLS